MTLVVAQLLGEHLAIVGDTHVTDPQAGGRPRLLEGVVKSPRTWRGRMVTAGGRPRLLEGVVKSRILADRFCVSFAGSLFWAEEGFRALDSAGCDGMEVTAVADVLLPIHARSLAEGRPVDFLIAGSAPPALIEIKDGTSRRTVVSWLGSATAFRRYQGYATGALVPPPRPPDTAAFGMIRVPEWRVGEPHPEYGHLLAAMQLVVEDAAEPEVGGLLVPVGRHNGRFEYLDYASVLTHPIRFDLMPARFAVPFGTAEQGGFAFCLMSDQVSSTRGLAVYFLAPLPFPWVERTYGGGMS